MVAPLGGEYVDPSTHARYHYLANLFYLQFTIHQCLLLDLRYLWRNALDKVSMELNQMYWCLNVPLLWLWAVTVEEIEMMIKTSDGSMTQL